MNDNISRPAARARVAEVISEVGGPAPLLLVCLLEVGLRSGSVLPTIVAAVSMAIVPYLITIWLARAGKVTDRFVGDRRQRTPILIGTLIVFVAGAVAVMLMGAPSSLRSFVIVVVGGLLIVTIINVRWKVSIHATLAAFFAGLQVYLFGPVALVALLVLAAVVWSRRALSAHTTGQLVAGSVLGFALVAAYAWLAGVLP